MGNLQKISLFGLCLGLILDIFAVSTPGWVYIQNYFARGLFYAVEDGETSSIIMGTADKLALAFLITGGSVLVFAIVSLLNSLKENEKDYKIIGASLGIIAGMFILTGMASYTSLFIDFVQPTRASWGYSFAFGWSSAWTSILSGCIGIFGTVKSHVASY